MSAIIKDGVYKSETKKLVILRELVASDNQKIGEKFYAVPRNLNASDSCVLRVVSRDFEEISAIAE